MTGSRTGRLSQPRLFIQDNERAWGKVEEGKEKPKENRILK
jgi:hypothetical protein